MASTENIEKPEKERQTAMFQGKNIHSSPVDGKLLCSFSEKTCMQRRLNHYAFCIRHVLEDKNAPFKQCKFVAKYNGQRCTNAIPVKEERIYCNSHLQVLGIVPKKSRKKKGQDHNDNTAKHMSRTPQAEIVIPPRTSQNAISRRTERTTTSAGTSKPSPVEKTSRKAKIVSSSPLLCELVNTYSQGSNNKRDLFSYYYGLCSSDEESQFGEESDDDCKLEMMDCGNSADSTNAECSKRPLRMANLRQLRRNLRAEFLGVKRSINAHNRDVKQSTKALGLLMTCIKASPSHTAVAIQNENNSFLVGSRKRSTLSKPEAIQCTATTGDKVKCQESAIPYTKYCSRHIINDSKQLLFHPCVAEVSANSRCSVPTLDLLGDGPLCRDHAKEKATYVPTPSNLPTSVADVALPPQKPPAAKKARRKPQIRAVPTQKPVKPTKKTAKKEPQKPLKSEKNKKQNVATVAVNQKQQVLLDNSMNHLNYERSPEYIPKTNLKMQLSSRDNDIRVFRDNTFKEPEMFDAQEMDVDESLENEDLNIPEDLGDISPTGMLRDTMLKLPLELSEPNGNSPIKQPHKSPIESFSMNPVSDGNPHKPIVSSTRVEPTKKPSLSSNNKQYEVTARVNHTNVLPGIRPSRSTVITIPKYPSNTAPLAPNLHRHTMSVSNAEFTSFTPIGPSIVKTEGAVRKPENRTIEVNHGSTLFPLPFDAVLNSSVTWGDGGKLVLNNRARPVLLNPPMNHATFSPPSLSPHISPQITLATAFNFDRPTVLQHSNSPSPTLSPFSATLPNSPHGKLAPRPVRLESRVNPNTSDMDPFFGASFDKP